MSGDDGRRATVVCGAGRFADPWHPFPETSSRLAEVARSAGFAVAEVDDLAAGLSRPTDLLVLDVGRPAEPDGLEDAAIRVALLDALQRGTGVLVMHSTVMSFPAVPEWEPLSGGVWVEGVSMHPPYGPARVRIIDVQHPITAGLADFTLDDERYTHLRIDPGVRVLAAHDHEGAVHPLLWTPVAGRVVVDVLGHDAASYDSAEHRVLLSRAMRWLVGDET